MGYLLKSGEVGNIGLKHQKAIREATVNKWDSLGFLEGLEGHVRENIALLYENQASVLINETTDSAGSNGSFETVVFPIIRRVFSKLLANDIVSVQALNLPIGKLFYFVPKISDRDNFTDPLLGNHRGPKVVNCINCPAVTFSGNTNLYDAFYDDALFDHSKGAITVNTVTGTAVTFASNTYTAGDEPLSNDGSRRRQLLEVAGFSQASAGRLIGPDGEEVDTEEFLASLRVIATNDILAHSSADPGNPTNVIVSAGNEVPFRVHTMQYGKGMINYGDICNANGNLYIELDLTTPVCVECGDNTFDGYIGASTGTTIDGGNTYVTWNSYDSLEEEDQMGEVSFELDSVTVSVTERKLRATWTPELAQDVSAFHNIDAEAELTALLSEQVAAEIDREILRDLRKGAAWSLRWDYNGWKRLPNNNGYTQKDWNQTLVTAINQISAQIHKSTLRGGANFVVVSSEVSAVFDDLEYFHVSNASPESDTYNMGIERAGSLGGRYTVYRDPYAPSYSVLIGHKGKSLLDTGYIYAPYVPMQLTPTMYNPFNFVPIKGIMTRYAKKMVNNRFYGHIRVDGLRTFPVAELR
jgi:hypothetical protein